MIQDPYRLLWREVLEPDRLEVVNQPANRGHLASLVEAHIEQPTSASYRGIPSENGELFGVGLGEVWQELRAQL